MFKDNAVLLQLKSQLSTGGTPTHLPKAAPKPATKPRHVAAPAAPAAPAEPVTGMDWPHVVGNPEASTKLANLANTPAAPKASRPASSVQMVKVTDHASAMIHSRGSVVDTIYTDSKNAIIEIAEKNWGKIGTDEKIQDILVKVMMSKGVAAANRLIIETRLNKLGWKIQHQYQAPTPAMAEGIGGA